jgi:hypothetical protein
MKKMRRALRGLYLIFMGERIIRRLEKIQDPMLRMVGYMQEFGERGYELMIREYAKKLRSR